MKRLIIVLITLFPVAGFAADPYLVVGLGASKAQDADQALNKAVDDLESLGVTVTKSSIDDEDSAGMIGIGGDLSDNVMFEVAYADLGEFDFSVTANGSNVNGGTKASTAYASILPHISSGAARLYGRVGAGYWDAEFEASTPGISVSESDNGWGPVLGAGVEYNLGRATFDWSIRAEWTRHFGVGESDTTGESDIDIALIGLVIRN